MKNSVKEVPSTRKVNQVINLDFSIPEHNDHFLGLYGGYDNLQKNLPHFFEAYEKTLEAHKNGIGLDYKTLRQMGDVECKDFVDGVDIEYVEFFFNNNNLSVLGVTSLVNTAKFVDQHLEVRTSAGEAVDGLSKSVANTSRASIELNTNFNPAEFQSGVLEIDYTSVWINNDTGLLRAQKSSEDREEFFTNNFVKSITLKNPVKKGTPDPSSPTKDVVVVAYGRQAAKGEAIDYMYQQDLITEDGKQYQRLFLDFGAAIELNPNIPRFKRIDPQTFILKLTTNNGMAQYSTAGRMDEISQRFSKTDNGFEFNLDSNWNERVPVARLPIRDKVDINMEVTYILENGQKGDINISSLANPNIFSPEDCKALPLNLLWGCLSKDTLVAMADGSQKLIAKIHLGDRILSDFNNQVAIVTNKWHGIENNPLWCIETEKNHRLKCSGQHPVVTQNGIKMADSLNGADLLIDKDGNSVAIVAIYPIEEKEVYNLDLTPEEGNVPANGMTMICNGLLVGDNNMQNHGVQIKTEENQINIHAEECEMKNIIFVKGCLL